MKMILLLVFAFILWFNPVIAQIQETVEKAIPRIANQLTLDIKNRNQNRVAITGFNFGGNANSRIGNHLANELNYALTRNGAPMMSRDVVLKKLAEYEATQQKKNNPAPATEQKKDSTDLSDLIISVAKLFKSKALTGVSTIIRGNIEDHGDYLRWTIELTKNNAHGETIGGADANLIITPEIRKLLGDPPPVSSSLPPAGSPPYPSPETTPTSPPVSGGAGPTFKHQSLTFEVTGCRQVDREVICNLNILSSNSNDELHIYKGNTRIIDGSNGHEFWATQMRMADISGTGHYIKKSLISNIPIQSELRFSVNQRVASIGILEVNCSDWNGYFMVQIYSIPVR